VQATLSAYTKAATVASVVLALEHNEVEEHNANVAESVLDLIRALWTRQSTLSTSSPTRHELLQRITAFITVSLGPPIQLQRRSPGRTTSRSEACTHSSRGKL
jgi:hypothetical protein